MKCQNCKRENNDGVKFCKFCGSPIGSNFTICRNGHNYDSALAGCPFCPTAGYDKTRMDTSGNEKTTIDNSSVSDRTIIDASAPSLTSKGYSGIGDKTVIFNPAPKGEFYTQTAGQSAVTQRKLVGWLVTFDINPNGVDYRLYEGRTKIGRTGRNDIIINQQGISDEHSIMLFRDNKFIIQDNLSTNGTFVNSVSIDEKVILKNDDVIKIGNVHLKLKVI
ncbi:MAG: FHA domain-containing protein [Ignavibacteria bacterium]